MDDESTNGALSWSSGRNGLQNHEEMNEGRVHLSHHAAPKAEELQSSSDSPGYNYPPMQPQASGYVHPAMMRMMMMNNYYLQQQQRYAHQMQTFPSVIGQSPSQPSYLYPTQVNTSSQAPLHLPPPVPPLPLHPTPSTEIPKSSDQVIYQATSSKGKPFMHQYGESSIETGSAVQTISRLEKELNILRRIESEHNVRQRHSYGSAEDGPDSTSILVELKNGASATETRLLPHVIASAKANSARLPTEKLRRRASSIMTLSSDGQVTPQIQPSPLSTLSPIAGEQLLALPIPIDSTASSFKSKGSTSGTSVTIPTPPVMTTSQSIAAEPKAAMLKRPPPNLPAKPTLNVGGESKTRSPFVLPAKPTLVEKRHALPRAEPASSISKANKIDHERTETSLIASCDKMSKSELALPGEISNILVGSEEPLIPNLMGQAMVTDDTLENGTEDLQISHQANVEQEIYPAIKPIARKQTKQGAITEQNTDTLAIVTGKKARKKARARDRKREQQRQVDLEVQLAAKVKMALRARSRGTTNTSTLSGAEELPKETRGQRKDRETEQLLHLKATSTQSTIGDTDMLLHDMHSSIQTIRDGAEELQDITMTSRQTAPDEIVSSQAHLGEVLDGREALEARLKQLIAAKAKLALRVAMDSVSSAESGAPPHPANIGVHDSTIPATSSDQYVQSTVDDAPLKMAGVNVHSVSPATLQSDQPQSELLDTDLFTSLNAAGTFEYASQIQHGEEHEESVVTEAGEIVAENHITNCSDRSLHDQEVHDVEKEKFIRTRAERSPSIVIIEEELEAGEIPSTAFYQAERESSIIIEEPLHVQPSKRQRRENSWGAPEGLCSNVDQTWPTALPTAPTASSFPSATDSVLPQHSNLSSSKGKAAEVHVLPNTNIDYRRRLNGHPLTTRRLPEQNSSLPEPDSMHSHMIRQEKELDAASSRFVPRDPRLINSVLSQRPASNHGGTSLMSSRVDHPNDGSYLMAGVQNGEFDYPDSYPYDHSVPRYVPPLHGRLPLRRVDDEFPPPLSTTNPQGELPGDIFEDYHMYGFNYPPMFDNALPLPSFVNGPSRSRGKVGPKKGTSTKALPYPQSAPLQHLDQGRGRGRGRGWGQVRGQNQGHGSGRGRARGAHADTHSHAQAQAQAQPQHQHQLIPVARPILAQHHPQPYPSSSHLPVYTDFEAQRRQMEAQRLAGYPIPRQSGSPEFGGAVFERRGPLLSMEENRHEPGHRQSGVHDLPSNPSRPS